jgi:metal-responsive CopG/Arc/MetJ family transcriptional regulator
MPEDRSKDRHKPRATIAGIEDVWDEFGQVVGDKNRSEVVRQMIAAFLKRPGVRMPRRKDYESR